MIPTSRAADRTRIRQWSLLLPLVFAVATAAPTFAQALADDPDWKRGAVCYEIFVRSFYDSDGDGIGDLNGLIQKLDYVNDGDPQTTGDLEARCIWLMPIAATRSYHGYDVTNYYRVNPEYGTNEDFKRLVAEAHRRGIRVLVDMVLNHMSSEHPYFKDASLNPASPYRDWFRWLPVHPGVRNPWGGDNWHRSAIRDEYYYGFFWRGMPDLNYATPAVRQEAARVARFWLEEMGVDGFRLDAIAFLVEEGDSVHHTAGTHAVLREYGDYVRRTAPAAFTIGEVWDSTAAMLPYYPDQLDAYFAFEVSDSIIAAVRNGSGRGLLEPVLRLERSIAAGRWAPFLRNHDQTRTRTALGGDPGKAAVAATLLLTLPGLPFVYYGEEIGMTGDKPDERLRTPMHWRRAAAAGFTTGTPWEPLQPDSMTANVEAQDRDEKSLLSHYRRLIRLRARNPALAAGEVVPLTTSHDAVAAYLRRAGNRAVLVVANLSDQALPGITLSSGQRALPPANYIAAEVLGGSGAAPLAVPSNGSITGYAPVSTLGPLESLVLELTAVNDR
ncbi:MAG TPA: alpha-amylase family glycosyl hydrolase [Gemmatimonadaceae bacterium]|nr:alpha-amylase family glycosyl hydrolase [Gemmatimonadaceae bacterium]